MEKILIACDLEGVNNVVGEAYSGLYKGCAEWEIARRQAALEINAAAEALFDIGWDDYLDRNGVCAVEWSENVAEAMENPITVTIHKLGENSRRITIEGGEQHALTGL